MYRPKNESRLCSLIEAVCLIVVILCVLGILSACSTVTPDVINAKAASFDKGNQTSGVLGELPDHSGFIITPHKKNEYNFLITTYSPRLKAFYGQLFAPPIKQDEGIKVDGKNYAIDNEHMSDFVIMVMEWRRDREP